MIANMLFDNSLLLHFLPSSFAAAMAFGALPWGFGAVALPWGFAMGLCHGGFRPHWNKLSHIVRDAIRTEAPPAERLDSSVASRIRKSWAESAPIKTVTPL